MTALRRAGIAFVEHHYTHDPRHTSYGREAAEALSCDPSAIFKTLICIADHAPVVAIIPVLTRVDLRSLAVVAQAKKAQLAQVPLAERLTGYRVGGISPLGQRTTLPTFLDAHALHHPTIFVSAGQRGCEIGLAPEDLITLTGAVVCDLGRDAIHQGVQKSSSQQQQ
jgi:Cys-tRNA(Pro)/Cys-tRNA(Cys) deacylase